MKRQDATLPPPERGQHDRITLLETPVAGVLVARADLDRRDALLVYTRLRLISEEQFTWGMLFRLDWYALHKEQRIISAYADYIDLGGNRGWWDEIVSKAAERYDKAARRLAGKGLLGIAISCICRGENVGVGRIKTLRLALDTLSVDGGKGGKPRKRVRGWRAKAS